MNTSILPKLASIELFNERLERTFREESIQLREQNQTQGKELREELHNTLRGLSDSLEKRFNLAGKRLDERLSIFFDRAINEFQKSTR